MAAANTDLFLKVAANTGWQLNASGISDAVVTSFGLVSSTGLPTNTAVLLTIDRVDSSGTKTPSKMERIKGVVSGNNIVSCIRGEEGTAQAHAGGAVVEIVISAANFNSYITAMIAGHTQLGVHDHGAVDVPTVAASATTTPGDTDLIPWIVSNVLTKITWANLKAAFNSIVLTLSPTTLTATGVIVPMTYGESITVGDVLYHYTSASTVKKALATGIATAPVIGLALATAASGSHNVLLRGIYKDSTRWTGGTALTVGGLIYLSDTSGAITQTQPTTTDHVVQVLGKAIATDTIEFNPSEDYLTHV